MKKIEFESIMIDEDIEDLARESSESSSDDDRQSQDGKCPDDQPDEIIPEALAPEASETAMEILEKTASAAAALEKAPAEVRDEYYKALSKAAITHAEIARKKAELELKKLEIECRMIDEDIEDLDQKYVSISRI